jgi:hypothetical protein
MDFMSFCEQVYVLAHLFIIYTHNMNFIILCEQVCVCVCSGSLVCNTGIKMDSI